MSTAVPAPPGATEPAPGARPPSGKPRKIYLVVGIVLAVALGVGLFTHRSSGSGSSGGQPGPGDPVPSFSAQNVGSSGPASVSVSSRGGKPTVLLFFGDWCSACHAELPPLAAAVARQEAGSGALRSVRVVGIDGLDAPSSAQAFIKSAGVTFPVAYDPDAAITAGKFAFAGDPYTVFVKADGTVARVVPGAQLTPASFTADERALLTPSGT